MCGWSCAQGNLATPILINISEKSAVPFAHPSSQQVSILDVFEGRQLVFHIRIRDFCDLWIPDLLLIYDIHAAAIGGGKKDLAMQ